MYSLLAYAEADRLSVSAPTRRSIWRRVGIEIDMRGFLIWLIDPMNAQVG
jgi:hypothetical protein